VRISSGVIRLDEARPFPERLPALRDCLQEVILHSRPTEAVLETCYVAQGVHAALVLGHVRGVLLLLCLEAGLAVYEYAPAEIKRAVTGEGAASKAQVATMLQRLVLDPPRRAGEDESDALAAAFCHMNRPALTRPKPMLQVR
jgi:crossover junction endodeoxyribonuclease RuvC